jgi:zona occludens toxin (predicted ATPase)
MIEIITGGPGTGKTLLTFELVLLVALKKGRNVYHNIPGIDFLKIAYYINRDPMDIEKLLHYSRVKEGDHIEDYDKTPAEYVDWIASMPLNSVGILDEAQNIIGARDWQAPKNVKFFEYSTVHRHSFHDVVLVTQNEDNIDISVRRINNLLIQLRRLDFLGWLFRDWVNYRSYSGHQTTNQIPMAKKFVKYNKVLFGLYQSYDLQDQGFKEDRNTGTVWNWKVAIPFVAVAVIAFTAPNFYRSVGFEKRAERAKSEKARVEKVKWLGDFNDYFCARDGLYVLRPGGSVDTLSTLGVPSSVCPSLNFNYGGKK